MTSHPDLNPLLDESPGPARSELLLHLRDCPACRAWLASRDPSRLFALLALEPVPAAFLERLTAAVDQAVPRVAGRSTGVERWGLASLAASLVLASLVGAYLWEREAATVPSGSAAERLVEAVEQPAGPAFELLSSPGTATVQVLDLPLGDSRLVMIFDKDLDL